MQYWTVQLNKLLEFTQKIEYINKVKEEKNIDCWMISDRGYEEIIGSKGMLRDIFLLTVILVVSFLIGFTTYSGEEKSNMLILIRSSSQGIKRVIARKKIMLVLLTGIISLALQLFNLVNLYGIYGMPYLDAPLASLSFMYGALPDSLLGISIVAFIVLRTCIVTVLGVLCALIGCRCHRNYY